VGRSRGGLTTKIHLLCDALGRPLRFLLTGGEKADCQSAEALLEGQQAGAVLADKGYDTNAIRSFIAAVGMQAVIPSKSNRKEPIPHDKELYKERNLIERCFGTLKKHRRIATRFDRNDSHYLGFLFLAASLLWL
jgi:transposase